jgi:hypothetical protein
MLSFAQAVKSEICRTNQEKRNMIFQTWVSSIKSKGGKRHRLKKKKGIQFWNSFAF